MCGPLRRRPQLQALVLACVLLWLGWWLPETLLRSHYEAIESKSGERKEETAWAEKNVRHD